MFCVILNIQSLYYIVFQVKERGRDVRLAYKDFRSKINVQNKNPRTKISTQPNSAPSSPSVQRRSSRPYTTAFTTASASYRKETPNGIQRLNEQKLVYFYDKLHLIL